MSGSDSRIRVLGVDPGSMVCGWGVLDQIRGKTIHVDNGCIVGGRNESFHDRLNGIYLGIREVIRRYGPDETALEDTFFSHNVQSAIKLGQARGAAILAAVHEGLKIYEYPPAEVKNAVTGYGRAGKEQISKMMKVLLCLPEVAAEDASDALAVALCHLNSRRMTRVIARRG